ncbi:hypothetical protein [Halomicronema sp. CCY15110]|uniref:hypothetical protein n=1 Tax=Halomicronema sp. CCY15110 TaxID=2767773 RepID=UPI00194DD9B8|nr:hypothetical protein [Halomicronema sp. CCY15110]
MLGAAGFFTFLGTVIAQGVESYTAMNLERQKYEYELISSILSDPEIEKNDAANQLLFLIKIEAIQALNTEVLEEAASTPENLPKLPEAPLNRRAAGTSR